MSHFGLHHPEYVTLSSGTAYSCHHQSQSSKIAHDKTIIAKPSIGKMGYISLAIRDTIYATKNYEGTSSDEFLGWTSRIKIDQTLWRSPDERRSVHDPDIHRTNLTTILRLHLKNGLYKKHHSKSKVVLVSPQNFVISCAFSLTEPCSNNVVKDNDLLIGTQLAEEIGVKYLKRTVTQNSLSIRFAEGTRSDIKTWCPITMRHHWKYT